MRSLLFIVLLALAVCAVMVTEDTSLLSETSVVAEEGKMAVTAPALYDTGPPLLSYGFAFDYWSTGDENDATALTDELIIAQINRDHIAGHDALGTLIHDETTKLACQNCPSPEVLRDRTVTVSAEVLCNGDCHNGLGNLQTGVHAQPFGHIG